PGLGRDLEERSAAAEQRGGMDQRVDAAAPRQRRLDQPGDVGGDRDVAANEGKVIDTQCGRGRRQVGRHDLGALVAEAPGAAGTAGDDRDLAGEPAAHSAASVTTQVAHSPAWMLRRCRTPMTMPSVAAVSRERTVPSGETMVASGAPALTRSPGDTWLSRKP